MKRRLWLFSIISLLAAGLIFFASPLALHIAKKQLKKGLRDAQVEIASCRVNPLSSIKFFDIKIQRVGTYDLKFEEIGIFYNPGSILKGKFNVAGRLNSGGFNGYVKIRLFPVYEYSIDLWLDRLDISSILSDLNLKDKVEMTGELTGAIRIIGKTGKLTILGGNLSAVQPGGTLTIKDSQYLNNVAQSSGQPVDLLMETLKNYSYNIGKFSIRKEKNDLVLDVFLQGETGKRDLTVVIHGLGG